MTNLGGPEFFFLVFGLFMTVGTPFVVGSWLALIHFLRLGVGTAFAYVNGGIFLVGLVLVTLWSMPLILDDPSLSTMQYIFGYVGIAVAVILLLEVLPLGVGILSAERYADAPRRPAAYAAAGGWLVGALVGLGVAALLLPGFLAAIGLVVGGIAGAAIGGPTLYSRFGAGNPAPA